MSNAPAEGPVARLLSGVGRAVHKVVHPQYAAEQARIDDLAKRITSSAAGARDQVDAVDRRIEALSDRVSQVALDRDVRSLHKQIEQLRDASGRQHKMLSQGLRYAEWEEGLRVDERRVDKRLKRLSRTNQPVLIGPWSGEVGFELLYWIPFVTWAVQKADVSPDRITVMSRGGPRSWYANLGGRYVDVLSQVSPEEFRAQTEAAKKQQTLGSFDRDMVRRAIAACGLQRPFLIHPGLMYRLFIPYWKQTATVRRVEKYTEYATIARPTVPALAGRLPDDYVAVRFYFSSSFPDTPENRAFAERTIGALSKAGHVVLLNTSFHLDDHRDFSTGQSARIHHVDDLMVPDGNLDVQTAVIAGARAFVGTYGGYAYLAPLCGVPSVAFYSVREAFFAHHLELAERIFRRLGAGSLVALDVADADLLRTTLT